MLSIRRIKYLMHCFEWVNCCCWFCKTLNLAHKGHVLYNTYLLLPIRSHVIKVIIILLMLSFVTKVVIGCEQILRFCKTVKVWNSLKAQYASGIFTGWQTAICVDICSTSSTWLAKGLSLFCTINLIGFKNGGRK